MKMKTYEIKLQIGLKTFGGVFRAFSDNDALKDALDHFNITRGQTFQVNYISEVRND